MLTLEGKMETPDNLLPSVPGAATFPHFSPNVHRLVVVLAALVLTLPCLVSGIPVAGDAITHVQYQHHFTDQFWAGDLYPRWLMNSNKGYGSPVFLVQYPLPYWITALIRPLVRFRPGPTREARELGVFCLLVLAAAGLATRVWLGKRFGEVTATTGAIACMAFPYILPFELYKSAAIGQLGASACMPMALAACDSLRLKPRSVSTLATVFALLVMSNLITAVLFLPLMVAYAVAGRESSTVSLRRCLVSLFLSLSIGAGMAGVYILPLLAYRHLFDLSVWAYLTPSYFAFVRASSLGVPRVAAALGSAAIITGVATYGIWTARRGLAWRLYMWCALGAGALMAVPGLGLQLIHASGLKAPILDIGRVYHPENMLVITLSTLALGVLAYCNVPKESLGRRDRTLFAAAYGSFFLMSPWSAFLWHVMPTLGTAIQFPHRFGAILVLASTGLFTAALDSALRRWPDREAVRSLTLVTSVALLVIVAGSFAWRANWRWTQGLRARAAYAYDQSQDVDQMYVTYVSPDRLPGVEKLLGIVPNSDRIENTPTAKGDAELVQGRGSVEVISRTPRQVVMSYSASGTSVMRMEQLYSPLWKRVLLDEKSGGLSIRSSNNGLLEVSLVPGRHYLKLLFELGWPERCGVIVTLVSLVILVVGVAFELYSNRASQNPGAATIGWGPGKQK